MHPNAFCDMPKAVDRIVRAINDKENILIYGDFDADGVTSTAMESSLLNAARGSIKELKEDYLDYIGSHKLALWTSGHARYGAMQDFCRQHNHIEDYEPFFERSISNSSNS
jgi:hypothetical protein